MATSHAGFRSRTTEARPRRGGRAACRVEVVENTLRAEDGELASAVEAEAHRLLQEEATLSEVRVRVKACRDDEDRLRFVCKVETPPRVDLDVLAPWRWWSGLLDSAGAFADSLGESLRLRRSRMGEPAR